MGLRTHEVFNQVDELTDYDLFATDPALVAGLERSGARWAAAELADFGAVLGRAETWRLACEANRFTPELDRYDARGRRIDQVSFHPSWHVLMQLLRGQGLVSLPFRDTRPGRWAAWAAGFYLQAQVEAGTLCPATMTQAAIPLLQREPKLWSELGEKLYSDAYDPRDLPIPEKASIWIGMGMTEKQGGSDVRANATTAEPVSPGGREHLLRGHKWFFSVPMSDAHLVTAKTPDGAPSCFFVPRFRPDGSRNAIRIERLKDKVGNRSNASSEVEFDEAWGVRVGEEGRGVATIIEMAGYTRLNCVVGSAALLRQGLVQALAYGRRRLAFGRFLADQPLMRAVLCDLALESEAAVALVLRLCEAFEAPEDHEDPLQRAWKRIMTPAAKLWVCKRAVEACGEAMEALGGNGYVEPGVMARLYREAPVNSIWEGSGNIMALDVIRAVAREPDSARTLIEDLTSSLSDEPRVRPELDALRDALSAPPDALQALSRGVAQRLVLLAQAALLRRHAPGFVADAFLASRFSPGWGRITGALDVRAIEVEALLQRAFPE